MRTNRVRWWWSEVLKNCVGVPLLDKCVPVWYKGGIYYVSDRYPVLIERYSPYMLIKVAPMVNELSAVVVIGNNGIGHYKWVDFYFKSYILTPAPIEVWALAMMKGRYDSVRGKV